MLTSYTSSEKENIPYIRKFAKNIKNNDGGAKLFCLKIPLTITRVDHLASCEKIVPRFQTSSGLLIRLNGFITVLFSIMRGWKIN